MERWRASAALRTTPTRGPLAEAKISGTRPPVCLNHATLSTLDLALALGLIEFEGRPAIEGGRDQGKSTVRLVAILGLTAAALAPAAANAAEYAYVTPSAVVCREEGYQSSAAVEHLQRGMMVTIVDKVDQWANIERGDLTCWVARRDLSSRCPFASSTPPARSSLVAARTSGPTAASRQSAR